MLDNFEGGWLYNELSQHMALLVLNLQWLGQESISDYI